MWQLYPNDSTSDTSFTFPKWTFSYRSRSLLPLRTSLFNKVFLGFLISLTPSLVNAAILFQGDFETGDISSWGCSGNCATVTTDQPRAGNYAGKAVLTRTSPVTYRTELLPYDDRGLLEVGKEYWLGWSNKLVDWAPEISPETVTQLHANYFNWDCGYGDSDFSPFWINTQNGHWIFYTRQNTLKGIKQWSTPYQTNVWNDWVVHIKVSSGTDGFIEAWKDGVKIYSETGQNYAAKDQCDNPMDSPFLKTGIYKWDWKEGSDQLPYSKSTRREVHIDEFRIGDARSSYSEVAPHGSTQTDATAPSTRQRKDLIRLGD
jgi:hypothetical protein